VDKYQETKNRYLREKVDKMTVIMPKGEKAKIQAYAKTKARSTNAYVLDLIYKDMGKDIDIDE
jgi:hypothetical protein